MTTMEAPVLSGASPDPLPVATETVFDEVEDAPPIRVRSYSPQSPTHDLPTWIPRFLQRLNDVALLDQDWDGRGAPPITIEAARAAVEVLMELTVELTVSMMPEPQVVPTTAGGLQIEWHIAGFDIEIGFDSKGFSDVYIENIETDDYQAGPFTELRITLVDLIRQISARI